MSLPQMHFLLMYDLAPDYLSRRSQFRNEHLLVAWRSADAGELLLGGALDAAADQAFLLFEGASPDVAIRFAENDPYVRHGLVQSWRVRKWNTVVGTNSASPLRPETTAG